MTKSWPGAAEGSGSKIGQPYKTTNGPMVVIWIGTTIGKALGIGTGTVQRVVMEQPRPFDVGVAEAGMPLSETERPG